MPAYTFPATANVVALAGATPVLVDVDPATFNLDPAARLRGRDAADAGGARRPPVRPAARLGRARRTPSRPRSCSSRTRPARSARAGAGCRAAASARWAASRSTRARSSRPARAARSRRTTRSSRTRSAACATTASSRAARSRSATPGLNYRLSDILCARRDPAGAPARRAARGARRASPRRTRSGSRGVVETPVRRRRATRTAGRPTSSGVDRRDEALAALRAEGIEAQIGTYALHLLAAYRDQGDFPGAREAFERALALPFSLAAPRRRDRARRGRARAVR